MCDLDVHMLQLLMKNVVEKITWKPGLQRGLLRGARMVNR